MPGSEDKTRLLLVTSNGWGMGHLTRQLAIAMAGQERATSTLFSLSLGLPAVIGEVPGEYCPGSDRQWVKGAHWHSYLCDRLVAIAKETKAEALLFDGVAPYPGLIRARPRLPRVHFTWMRRGLWRPGEHRDRLGRGEVFDLIIEPGDLAAEADRGATAGLTDAVKVSPVTMLDVVEPLPREEAARALGLDPERLTVLVTLGSGRLGDITEPATVVLRTLLSDPRWQICLTKASIALQGVPVLDPERIVELKGVYPLVRYLAAFDAVISAAGYNAVHEFIPAALPTLFVPNPVTFTDDQEARAQWLADRGLALTARADQPDLLASLTSSLADPVVRRDLIEACTEVPPKNLRGGAAQTADLLVKEAATFRPAPGSSLREATHLTASAGREAVKRLLGPRVTNGLRRLLGRPTYGDKADQLPVQIVTEWSQSSGTVEPLYLGSEVTGEMIRQGPPVEHVLAGASNRYRRRRRRIVSRYYSVRRT
ncbi:MAG TPA: glycosyltransferase [Acidimicrobiia bacterium]|nr:glycosyltransferase [Acidimicrobiia bacterium]